MGSRCTIQAPRDVYRTRDGKYVALSTGTQAMAERLFAALGRPELNDDPRFRTNAARLHNRDALEALVGTFIAERSQAEALAFSATPGALRRPAPTLGEHNAELLRGHGYDMAEIRQLSEAGALSS